MTATVLVVGATGILRPAVQTLCRRGVRVVAVSRRGADSSIAVDARDAGALATALADESWDDAVVYDPAVTEASLAFLRASTPGRCVHVRTSGAADPTHGALVVCRDTLQLGWTREKPHRWHTPDEVSATALEVLADGVPRTLGVVRPWSGRP